MSNETFHTAWSAADRQRYRQQGYWSDQPLGEHLHQWACAFPQRCALVSGAQRLTYLQLDTLADRLAAGFAARGIKPQDNVLVQMPNTLGLVAGLFALFRLGARPILAMPGQKSADIDALCRLANPVAWLFPSHYLGNDYPALAADMAEKHPLMQQYKIDTQQDPEALMPEFQSAVQDFPAPDPESVALLLLSGGSTGTPKLIPRTHADYLYNARAAAAVCQLDRHSTYLATLAVAHNFTLSCPGVIGTLLSGGKVVLAQTASCDEIFPLIEQERVTFTALVPPLVNLWLECREWDDSDLSSLELIQVGGSRLESQLAARVKPAFGCQLQQVFGMAEGLICCTRLDDPDDVIFHTQGRPLSPDDRLRVVDNDDKPLTAGESGELLTRGPYTIGGYYRADAQNRQAFTPEGFYRSGDIVRLTPDGNIQVEGRIKEQINRAGEKIATAEVESLLTAHPAIVSCVLVAVPDERLGERSCACVQANQPLTLAEVRGYLQQQQLSDHKLPDQLMQVSSWPLTAVGKIDKRKLAENARHVHLPPCVQADVPLQCDPLDVCYHLLNSDWETSVAWERENEWTIGLEKLAHIDLFADSATLRVNQSAPQRWQGSNWQENLRQALDALPFPRWQAFAVGCFELAGLFHDIPLRREGNAPLLTLIVPRYLLTLRKGEAELAVQNHDDLLFLRQALQSADRPVSMQHQQDPWLTDFQHQLSRQGASDYCQRVSQAVTEIQNGDYQKVILSRRVLVDEQIDLLASYHLGRRHNTPARSFAVNFAGHRFIGFSPETVVEVDSLGNISTQPLAGTRALTRDEQRNAQLRAELTQDTKEIAEHAVSVKLSLEEMLSVAEPGSASVSDFMQISRRGSVQHLASRVRGKLASSSSAWDAFAAFFPAVTASGIPKRAALDAIQRLEPCSRGAYSGSVIMLNSDGELDAALVLRSLYQLPEGFAIQAGAGIIDQSQPERELEETIEKLQSVSRYLVRRM